MNERDAEQLAVVVTEEWAEASPPWLGGATSPDVDPSEPRVGAYWPIGSVLLFPSKDIRSVPE
jgi:hypothetical protein